MHLHEGLQAVVAYTANKTVVSGVSKKGVIACTANQRVVAATTNDRIVACPTINRVVISATNDGVGDRVANDVPTGQCGGKGRVFKSRDGVEVCFGGCYGA